MTTWQFWIAATCETGTAVTSESKIAVCKVRTVTPITRAIIRMNSRGTARAAATAPPIRGLVEDRPFTYPRPRRS